MGRSFGAEHTFTTDRLGPVLAMIENTLFRAGGNLGNVKKTTKDRPEGRP
jgi:hypothetical protein